MYKYFLENKHEFMKLIKKEVESRSSWLIDKENPHMSDVKSGNIINFLDHISELGNKKIIYEKFKNHSFIPKTFVNTLPTKQDVYFIKNVKRDSARGLYVVNNVKDIKLNSNFICQPQIKNLKLINGKKFDLRMHVVYYQQNNVMRSFIHKSGHLRIASLPFDENSINKFVQLTNSGVNIKHTDYDAELNQPIFNNKIEFYDIIYPKIVKIVTEINSLLTYKINKGSHLLGYDFIIDNENRVYLLECNNCPGFKLKSKTFMKEVSDPMFKDIIDGIEALIDNQRIDLGNNWDNVSPKYLYKIEYGIVNNSALKEVLSKRKHWIESDIEFKPHNKIIKRKFRREWTNIDTKLHYSDISNVSKSKSNLGFLQTICDKDTMYEFLKGEDFLPRTYVIRNNQWVNYIPDLNSAPIWFVKEAKGFNGDGIEIINNKINLNELDSSKSYVVQEHIPNPHLINNKKWDIRYYVLLCVKNGIVNVYLYNDGIIKINHKDWSESTDKSVQMSTVFTSHLDKRQPISELPFADKIYSQIETITQRIMEKTYNKLEVYNDSCYEMLSYDIIMDKDYKLWLIEINRNSYMGRLYPANIYEPIFKPMMEELVDIAIEPYFNVRNNVQIKNWNPIFLSNLMVDKCKVILFDVELTDNNVKYIDSLRQKKYKIGYVGNIPQKYNRFKYVDNLDKILNQIKYTNNNILLFSKQIIPHIRCYKTTILNEYIIYNALNLFLKKI